jgi:hypothetical protein
VPENLFLRELGPEAFEIALGFGAEPAVRIHARDVCLPHEFRARREHAIFLKHRFDGRHAFLRRGFRVIR